MTDTTQNHNTSKYAFGFYDRLEELMVLCGYRRHGILTSIANISDLSVAGARLMKTNNRPPRETYLATLVAQLTKDVNDLGKGVVSAAEVQSYLLDNVELPIASGMAKATDDSQINTDYATSVVMVILEATNNKNLEINATEKRELIELVLTRILKYCAVNKPEVDSPELKGVIDSMISIASTPGGRAVLLNQ